jgi:hypothetical protein
MAFKHQEGKGLADDAMKQSGRPSQFKAENVWEGHDEYKPTKSFTDLLAKIETELTSAAWQNDFGTTTGGTWRFTYLKNLLELQLKLVTFGVYGARVKMLQAGFNPGQEDLRHEVFHYNRIAVLFNTLLPILDSDGLKDLRYIDATAVVNYECKVVVCDIISQIMDMRLDDRLDVVISEVETIYDSLPIEERSELALSNPGHAGDRTPQEQWAEKIAMRLFESRPAAGAGIRRWARSLAPLHTPRHD